MADAGALARTVVAALVQAGVRDVVLAPGSRSAPLAFVLWAAERAGSLRLHVRVDERGAGFVALGLAKATERPVAVVTTSGTAVANLHPAVLEAWHSHVPLVVVSADRPAALRWTGANQTTHQQDLFASHVRAAATLTDERDAPFEVARLLVAATGSRSRLPGPVHLDVELVDPLVPDPGELGRALPAVTLPTVRPTGAGAALELARGPRTVVVAGDAPPALGRAWALRAAAASVPLLAEPSSNARSGPAAVATYRLLLAGSAGSAGLAEEVERVVVVGHPTLSRPVQRLLARRDVELVVVSPYADWPDPGRAATVVAGDAVLPAPGPAETAWAATWRESDRRVRTRLDALLAGWPGLTGAEVAAAVLAGLGPEDVLLVGSSNPVRDLDLAAVPEQPPATYANRGLAGIDGLVSTAGGLALGHDRPVTALLGDLTLLHDANALVVGPLERRPDLRLVVVNDDGGSIFTTLEQGGAAYAEAFERVFGTPQRARLEGFAEAAGAAYRRVTTTVDLRDALSRPPRGIELVEVPVDRAQRRALDEAVRALGA
ncbi:2-succinyl-5-enolpyruvyl-6-hydroxy-3-cyclohexene-1-carboxylic-acid synthase [Microlunatus flavus]|uniref:2-succinyl-5-enolpyruvyl-6-hydroxy-3-cyclohexene-1-carboxylate synthase n=1 Tax=Microlunatus flavus TaxID=1036181 RepID=A0A1H9LY12_9ACTN|nr:2-succinyl-5-enolpyruvyl-6-hydroxy-3-cyclohexene-1-carboxylic-acid synthase [Microlunatus flavus]SER16321.1 2-succinyl-5-enolpyruvyl-6-hydroxy-3-cyclohexene-1-carboxylate synthase [Microlunatus flavus]